MWELSDPTLPKHRKGSSLDKFLLLPGTDIPEELLPTQSHDWFMNEEDNFQGEETKDAHTPFYPAHTFSYPVMADRHPVMLTLKCAWEVSPKEHKAYRLKNLREEEWASLNKKLGQFLSENSAYLAECTARNNTTGYLQRLVMGIRSHLGDHYQRAEGKAEGPNPFELFYRRHISDPEYPLLIRAHAEGNDLLKRKLMADMIRRG